MKQRDIDVPNNLAERRDNGNHHFHNACYIFASNAAIECIDKDTLTATNVTIMTSVMPSESTRLWIETGGSKNDEPSPPRTAALGGRGWISSSWHTLSTGFERHVRSIGALGSVSIAVNFLTGPAMLELPALFQKSGLVPTTLTILAVCRLSSLCSLHTAQALSKLPGNTNFDVPMEYSQAFDRAFGKDDEPEDEREEEDDLLIRKSSPFTEQNGGEVLQEPQRRHSCWFWSTQVTFFLCVTCLNVSSLVDSAQVFDALLAHVFGSTRALLVVSPLYTSIGASLVSWNYDACTNEQLFEGTCIPFSDTNESDSAGGYLFTAGYCVTALFFMPLALMDLKENAAWQVIEFLVLIVTSIIFCYLFLSKGDILSAQSSIFHEAGQEEKAPAIIGFLSLWGSSWDTLMGVVLFNFALVVSIPAWLFEKEESVDVSAVVHGSSAMAAILYIVLGVLGAMVIPSVSENMLETFLSGVLGVEMQITAFWFAIFIVGLGIPLLSVLCRLNLTCSEYISQRTGNLLAVYLPFGMSWLAYRGDSVTQLLSWGGILFTSLVAFLFPLLLGLQTLNRFPNREGSIPVQKCHETVPQKRRGLYVLLLLSVLSVLAAILGNLAQQE